ncbi:MAG: hypothetical protein KatS3mg035_2154 [Bacteroidia bacterium]|nr:MAG: hypothetical protein KatS3mg035_2107 [Bacteroidia bacterium]GIV45031.1 MAG: hypothetical protein KatS3mg035_2154 [Bacteroidia bacterium]
MKKYLIVILTQMLIACNLSENPNNNTKIVLIKSFLNDVKTNSPDKILNKYFVSLEGDEKKFEILKHRTNQLKKLSMIIDEKSYKVVPFNEYVENDLMIIEGMNSSEIFVIVIEEQKNIYIKLKGNKIESISPIVKGNRIIGWL